MTSIYGTYRIILYIEQPEYPLANKFYAPSIVCLNIKVRVLPNDFSTSLELQIIAFDYDKKKNTLIRAAGQRTDLIRTYYALAIEHAVDVARAGGQAYENKDARPFRIRQGTDSRSL